MHHTTVAAQISDSKHIAAITSTAISMNANSSELTRGGEERLLCLNELGQIL